MDREEPTELHAAFEPPVTTATLEAELTTEAKPHAPWVRNINDYERRETTLVEGLRYGRPRLVSFTGFIEVHDPLRVLRGFWQV
jgi:hypothetical protein